jgi:hypothetical protein
LVKYFLRKICKVGTSLGQPKGTQLQQGKRGNDKSTPTKNREHGKSSQEQQHNKDAVHANTLSSAPVTSQHDRSKQ